MSSGTEARRLLRRCRNGSLGTNSLRLPGYPYVSIVPFMLDHDGNPVVLLSRLAEHTKNIATDQRVSLAAQERADDIQASARLSLCGTCRPDAQRTELTARYLRYFPNAAALLDLDFDFYRISPVAVLYIGGFGAVNWVSPQEFSSPSNSIAGIEDNVLAEMNCNHAHALHEFCHQKRGLSASKVVMAGLDCDGFDVRADDKLIRFEFSDTVQDAKSVCSPVAVLARECRS